MSKTLDLYDIVASAQLPLERAETAMAALNIDYFNDLRNNPNTPKGSTCIVNDFNLYRIYSDIVYDYLIELRGLLAEAEALAAEALEGARQVVA